MINTNEIVQGIEVVITLGVILISHFNSNSKIKKHVSVEIEKCLEKIPEINGVVNDLKDFTNKITPVAENMLPAETKNIELIQRVIDGIGTGIDEITSINYQKKASILKSAIEKFITDNNLQLSNEENNLIEEYIIKLLNKKINNPTKKIIPLG